MANTDGVQRLVVADRDGSHYSLWAPSDDYIGDIIARTGRPYEELLLAVSSSLLPTAGVVLDVGANIGNHSIYWARRGLRVEAFEPNPVAIELLMRNIADNNLQSAVTHHPQGLGRRFSSGHVQAYSDKNLGGASIAEGSGDIALIPLDGLPFQRIDCIKIDVEGGEAEVVAGAMNTIKRHKPIMIVETAYHGRAADMLRHLGYSSFPLSLGQETPTYFFAPTNSGALRILFSLPVLRRGLVRLGPGVARRLNLRARSSRPR